jgi:CTP:molybdopterin cytidylyltransferase MocA
MTTGAYGDTTAPPSVAIVLVAGRSERLRAVTGGGSKALVRVGGMALVERAEDHRPRGEPDVEVARLPVR